MYLELHQKIRDRFVEVVRQVFGVDTRVPALGYPPSVEMGDLSITSNASTGAGILLVNGNVTFHGGFSYTGLIICSGTVNFTGGGSDDVNIHGAVIAGDAP